MKIKKYLIGSPAPNIEVGHTQDGAPRIVGGQEATPSKFFLKKYTLDY